MPHPFRVGIKLAGQDTTAETLREVWRIADEGGLDHVWCFDHVAAIGEGGPDRPVFEGWSLQAAMAVATKRVRIGCMVTGNTYRPPWMQAKIAVTVDHLSGGRLEFGIGAAWAEIEHQMYDVGGLDHRVGRLSESLRIIKALWTEDRVDFAGRYYTLHDAIANPKPVQKPHPPIWIGAGGDQLLRLTARHADVWNASGVSQSAKGASGRDAIVELSERLDAACHAIGRDPATLRRSVQLPWDGGDAASFIDLSARRHAQGFTEQIVMLPPADAVRVATSVAEVVPDLRAAVRGTALAS
jgi:alkanesulfonate monooxygenase SsuD/methylene tetrahydromethanopterin reductase-like flavin-dependent oxidoreductase (luciferase family)